MSFLKGLASLSEDELERKGIKYTLREILSQPDLWIRSFEVLREKMDEVRGFVEERILSNRCLKVILSGAGSSHYIGLSCEDLLRTLWGVDVMSKACTDIVTGWRSIFLKDVRTTLICFSRSGESPEILGTFLLADKHCEDINHIIVTCNKDGRLLSLKSRAEDEGERNVLRIVLPEEANDKGLAMTSSFTTMLMTAQFLAYIQQIDEYWRVLRDASLAAGKILSEYADLIKEISDLNFNRAFFLGSGPLYGCAAESHLKLQELTSGRIICKFDSYLGVRHGPEAAIDDKTLVVYFVSSDPFIRRYEVDLMDDLKSKGLGLKKVAVCCDLSSEVERYADYVINVGGERSLIPDYCRPIVDVIVGQLLGLFKSLNMGLKPDNPSERGVITRVVRGVKIYDEEAFEKSSQFKIVFQ